MFIQFIYSEEATKSPNFFDAKVKCSYSIHIRYSIVKDSNADLTVANGSSKIGP